MMSLRVPPSTSCLTSAKNADRIGYVSLGSFTLTIRTSAFSSTSSCITSPPRGNAPSAPAPLGLLGPEQQARELLAPAVDPALDRPLRRSEPVRHLLVAQPLQVAQHHRLPQLLGERLQPPPQEAAPVAVLERAMRAAPRGSRREVEGDQVFDQHFLLALARPVVVDAEVPG